MPKWASGLWTITGERERECVARADHQNTLSSMCLSLSLSLSKVADAANPATCSDSFVTAQQQFTTHVIKVKERKNTLVTDFKHTISRAFSILQTEKDTHKEKPEKRSHTHTHTISLWLHFVPESSCGGVGVKQCLWPVALQVLEHPTLNARC